MAHSSRRPARRKRRRSQPAKPETVRGFQSRGVDVEIREAGETVELSLDGHPIAVTKDGDEFHSQLANQFMAFPTIDDVVETLLRNEGRTWTLHGHLCDERCTARGHHSDEGHAHGGSEHDHAGHDHHEHDDHDHGP